MRSLALPVRRLGLGHSRRGHQVHGLVQQEHAPGALVGGHRRRGIHILLVVLEDDGDVDIAGPQHPQRLRRLRLGQHELHAGRLGRQPRRGGRDQGAERRRERGQADPAFAQADVRREFGFGRVQSAR